MKRYISGVINDYERYLEKMEKAYGIQFPEEFRARAEKERYYYFAGISTERDVLRSILELWDAAYEMKGEKS